MGTFPDRSRLIDGVNRAYAGIRRPVTSGNGATVSLKTADANAINLFDRAAGIIYTLPATTVGAVFTFMATVSVTSNNYKVITGTATELLIGSVLSEDTDSGDVAVFFPANGSTHIAVTMNGSTTGGLKGTRLTFTCLSTTLWMVDGVNAGSGTVATPFATS